MATCNCIFDAIEDEIIKALESDLYFPNQITICLENESFLALIRAGMTHGGKPVPETSRYLVCWMAGILVRLEPDSYPEDLRH